MSYIKKVLADKPLGFWSLDTTNDLTGGGNSLVFNSAPTYTDILPLNTSTYKDLDTNEYVEIKGLYVDTDTDAYINNEYNIFVNGTEALSFGIEFWISIPPNNMDSVQSFLYINDVNQDTVGYISRNQDVISFTVFDGDHFYTASKQIRSIESQLHIFAYYSNRTISISVNGMPGEPLILPFDFKFLTDFTNKNDINFVIPGNPSSLIMNSLALYDHSLSQNQIRSHMIWGFSDAKPQSYVKQTAGDFFDIQENPSMKWYEKAFDTDRSFKDGTINNLYTIDNGLTHRRSSAAYAASGGLNYKFDDLLNYISLNNFSMSTTVDWDALPVYTDDPIEENMILKITGNDDSEFVHLAKTEDGSLGLYYTYANNSDVLLLQTEAVLGTTPIFFSVKNNFVNIYIDSGGSASGNVFPNFLATTTKLYLNNTAYMIDGLNIFNSYIDSNSYYEGIVSYEDNLILSLTNVIRTKGIWNYSAPASLFYGIAGSKLSWNTATATNDQYLLSSQTQSVCIQVQTEPNGDWYIIKNGGQIPAFAGTGSPAFDVKIRITILSDDASSLYQPRIDNFNISIYKSIDVLSDSKNYVIKPYYEEGSNILHTYNLRSNNFNVLSRSNNFGIKIDNGNTAIMMPTVPTTGFQTLEFWFRPDGINEDSQDQYIVNNSVTGEYLKFDKDTLELSQDIGTPFLWVYVNGLDLAENPRTLIIDEPYHIICVYYENKNINNVFINSDTNLENYAIGTYGYFATYPNQLSAEDAKNRYISYLTSFTEIVNESNTIGTIAEYSGISTDYNAGNPIHSYQNASTRP